MKTIAAIITTLLMVGCATPNLTKTAGPPGMPLPPTITAAQVASPSGDTSRVIPTVDSIYQIASSGGTNSPATTQTATIADSGDGSAAVDTLTPTPDVSIARLDVTCSDTDGCNPIMSKTSMVDGQIIVIVNVSSNDLNFVDDPGVLEMIGDSTVVLRQYEQIVLQYATDRWIMLNASVDSLSGCFNGTSRSVAPSYPTDGCVYISQNGAGEDWTGLTVQGLVDYIVVYDGGYYQPLHHVDLTPVILEAVHPNPVEGWYYWFDTYGSQAGTADPDTEVCGDQPDCDSSGPGVVKYRTRYNGTTLITDLKSDGTALSSTWGSRCQTYAGITDSMDYMFHKFPYDVTIKRVNITQRGATNVVGHLEECDSAGASCAGVDGATDITATTTSDDDLSLSNPSIDANDVIQFRVTTVNGTNTDAMVCVYYTLDD